MKSPHPVEAIAINPYAKGLGVAYTLGDGVERTLVAPYEHKRDDPLSRLLRIYTVDPTAPRLENAVATVDVAYEPLDVGPVGRLFEVSNQDRSRNVQ